MQPQHHDGPPPLDRTLFGSGLVTIGAFRAAVDHPRFHDSGPTSDAIFVFPRTSVEIQHEAGRPFTADPCTVTYYNAGQRYLRRAVDARGDASDWFAVRPDVLHEIVAARDPSVADRPDRPFALTHGPSDPASYALQRMIVRHVHEAPAPDPLPVEEAVVRLLGRLLGLACARAEALPSAGEEPRRDPRVHNVRSFLLANFRRAASLDELARAAGSSVFQLCRAFRRELGTTVHRYRNQLRLRRSLELVADGGSDLSRVAFDLGFSSHSHFTAAFRQAFAITPSEFRRAASSRRIRALASRLDDASGNPARTGRAGF